MDIYNRLSIAISFGCISAFDYIKVIDKYKPFIHDLFFSPVEDIKFQTRRLNYDFASTTIKERYDELTKVIDYANNSNLSITLTLNSPNMTTTEAVEVFELYYKKYNIKNVTTFCDIASSLKERYSDLNFICSYNEGITDLSKLKQILNLKLFKTIVFGSSMLHNFQAFKLAKEQGNKVSIIANTGCMLDCHLFCRKSFLCKSQFDRHLRDEGINHLYATTSIFPEELLTYYLPSGNIDYIKLASRPINKEELDKLLNAYTNGNTLSFIQNSESNYHLYGRLGHFAPHYSEIDFNEVLLEKQKMWKQIFIE